ncbi:MAG TPA: hypothetical protein VKR56_09810 [Candidatus Cybelea sp.]|nr:hypothetical protein [Candidatus Cybelea sp.]
MRKTLVLVALAAVAFVPGAAVAQMTAGGSPHGFDWMLGTWTCKNTVPTPLGGPAVQTLTAVRSATTNAIVWRYTGSGYDQYGFLAYDGKSGMWWSSWAYPGGSIGNESAKAGGKKTTWSGLIVNAASGKTEHIRDLYTVYGPTTFNDTGWDDATGSMKISYNGTCTKM